MPSSSPRTTRASSSHETCNTAPRPRVSCEQCFVENGAGPRFDQIDAFLEGLAHLQGIYSWTGARPAEVEKRLRKISGAPFGLGVSYRSSPKVLAVLNLGSVSPGSGDRTRGRRWFPQEGSQERRPVAQHHRRTALHQRQKTVRRPALARASENLRSDRAARIWSPVEIRGSSENNTTCSFVRENSSMLLRCTRRLRLIPYICSLLDRSSVGRGLRGECCQSRGVHSNRTRGGDGFCRECEWPTRDSGGDWRDHAPAELWRFSTRFIRRGRRAPRSSDRTVVLVASDRQHRDLCLLCRDQGPFLDTEQSRLSCRFFPSERTRHCRNHLPE